MGNLRSEISDDFNLSNSNVSVAGRLKYRLDYWLHVLKAGDFVVDIIRSGYMLPFHHTPDPCHLMNNKSAIKYTSFVEEAITKLLKDKCTEEVYSKPYCVNPLTVLEGKKLRFVLDLRHVNKYLVVPRFKYENLKSVSEIF